MESKWRQNVADYGLVESVASFQLASPYQLLCARILTPGWPYLIVNRSFGTINFAVGYLLDDDRVANFLGAAIPKLGSLTRFPYGWDVEPDNP